MSVFVGFEMTEEQLETMRTLLRKLGVEPDKTDVVMFGQFVTAVADKAAEEGIEPIEGEKEALDELRDFNLINEEQYNAKLKELEDNEED